MQILTITYLDEHKMHSSALTKCIYIYTYVTVLAKRDHLRKNIIVTVEAVFGQNTKTFSCNVFLFFLVSSIFYPLATLMLSLREWKYF